MYSRTHSLIIDTCRAVTLNFNNSLVNSVMISGDSEPLSCVGASVHSSASVWDEIYQVLLCLHLHTNLI